MHTRLSLRRAAAVVATLLILGAGCAADLQPTSGATSEDSSDDWLLFQGSVADRTLVSLVRRDGSGVTSPMAALSGGDQTNPDWDPTGTRVAFTMSDGESEDLWVAATDGSQATKLLDCVSPCQWIDDASWSPDGESIVFSRTVTRGKRGVGTLETVQVSSGRTSVVLGPNTRKFTAGARWSPDGRRVVFEMVNKAGPGLEADIDGVVLSIIALDHPDRPVRSLTPPNLYAATADWSRDGRRIVYSALATPSGSAPELFTISPRGGKPTRVTRLAPLGGYAAEPTWSKDGRTLVFSGRVDSPGAPLLLTVSATGGPVTSATGAVQTLGRHPRLQP